MVNRYITIREKEINDKLRQESEVNRAIVLGHYKKIVNVCADETNIKDPRFLRIYRETTADLAKVAGLMIDRIKVDQPVLLPDVQKMAKVDRKKLIEQLEERLPVGTKVN
jgi:hypothetical protein